MVRGSLSAGAIVGTLALGCLLLTGGERQDKPATAPNQDYQRIGVNDSIRFHDNIVFGKGGGTELRLDLRMPLGEGPFPTIICLHAGGWIGGDRQKMHGTLEALARRGYVAVSPDYRLAPKDHFPAQIEDCKAAVRWLRANAGEYHVNPERIGAFGYSAGAHLAALLGVTRKEDGLEGDGGNAEQSSAVQAVVCFFGPSDFTQPVFSKAVREKHLMPLLGGTAEEKPDVYRRASPVTYVRKESPPFLCVHGTADEIIPIQQSEALVEKLRQAGVSARLISMEGEGHGKDWKRDNSLLSLARMLDFFDENLKK